MQQGMVYFPKDPVWVGPPIAELLRFPNGVHDDHGMLAWIGLMMTEFATFVEKIEHEPSWRDKLKYLAKSDKRISYEFLMNYSKKKKS